MIFFAKVSDLPRFPRVDIENHFRILMQHMSEKFILQRDTDFFFFILNFYNNDVHVRFILYIHTNSIQFIFTAFCFLRRWFVWVPAAFRFIFHFISFLFDSVHRRTHKNEIYSAHIFVERVCASCWAEYTCVSRTETSLYRHLYTESVCDRAWVRVWVWVRVHSMHDFELFISLCTHKNAYTLGKLIDVMTWAFEHEALASNETAKIYANEKKKKKYSTDWNKRTWNVASME